MKAISELHASVTTVRNDPIQAQIRVDTDGNKATLETGRANGWSVSLERSFSALRLNSRLSRGDATGFCSVRETPGES